MKVAPESLCMGCMEPLDGSVCSHCGWHDGLPPESPVFLPPKTILRGTYMLGTVLGAGGFGITYIAWDLDLECRLAIKEYFPTAFGMRHPDRATVVPSGFQNQQAFEYGLKRFLEEGQALAKFRNNPGIASIIAYFRENGTSYLVMNYEDGITFLKYLKNHGGRIEWKSAIEILMPVMDALKAVHKAGLLHRDVSPDNIFINRNGQVKILDFGSAKHEMASRERSVSLQVALKRGYSPEEQYRTGGNQGPWTDVYALGATLYHAITGTVPPESLDRQDGTDPLQPPSRLGIEIPEHVENTLLKAMAVKAPNRFQTVDEMQKALAGKSRDDRAADKIVDDDKKPDGKKPDDRQPEPERKNGPRLKVGRRAAITGGLVAVLIASVALLRGALSVPEIQQFTVEPANVAAGGKVLLRWAVTGGRVSIDPAIGTITELRGSREMSPATTATYTLTASGPLRSVTKTAKVVVTPKPLGVILAARPSTIQRGESAELTWSVDSGATSVSIEPGIGPVQSNGSLKVAPKENITYILKAQRPDGSKSESSVTVLIAAPVPKPVILSFASNPASITKGQFAQLSWAVNGDADTVVTLDQGIGRIKLRDNIQVAPAVTTKYKIAARNPGGAITRDLTVTVVEPQLPQISRFDSVPSAIGQGQSATLNWTVTGATESVIIQPGLGAVEPSGSRQVRPGATTNYVLTARGPGGVVTRGQTVAVSAPLPQPVISGFSASQKIVSPGDPVTLSWHVGGPVDSVTIRPEGPVPLQGSRIVKPMVTTVYVLTARGPGGTASQSLSVAVSTETLTVRRFDISPSKVKRGEGAEISWSVTGPVTSVTILPELGQIEEKSGTRTVHPVKNTTYTIKIEAGGRSVEKEAKIKVR